MASSQPLKGSCKNLTARKLRQVANGIKLCAEEVEPFSLEIMKRNPAYVYLLGENIRVPPIFDMDGNFYLDPNGHFPGRSDQQKNYHGRGGTIKRMMADAAEKILHTPKGSKKNFRKRRSGKPTQKSSLDIEMAKSSFPNSMAVETLDAVTEVTENLLSLLELSVCALEAAGLSDDDDVDENNDVANYESLERSIKISDLYTIPEAAAY